jgi:hypothetical protein
MLTRRTGRLSAAAAQRLLDGGGGPPPLPQLLAAAAAPPAPAELRGEPAARAAFRSSLHTAPRPHDIPRKSPVRATSTFMVAKAIAAIALTASTAGGIALATSSTPADPPARTTSESAATDAAPASLVVATPGPGAVLDDPDGTAGARAAAPPGRPASAGTAAHPTGLCQASSHIGDRAGKAAESPAFTDLSCTDADPDAQATRPTGRPSAAPRNPGERTGKPDTTDRANDNTDTDTPDEAEAEKPDKPADDQAEDQAEDQADAARTAKLDRGQSGENRRTG